MIVADGIKSEIKAKEGEIEQQQVSLKELRDKVQKEMDEAGPVLTREQLEAIIAQLEQDTQHWEQVIEETIGKEHEVQKAIEGVQKEIDKKKFEADTLEDKVRKLKEEIEAKNKPELTSLAGAVTKSAFSGATLKATLTAEIEKLRADLEKQLQEVHISIQLFLGFH